jgi:hypothetical protein
MKTHELKLSEDFFPYVVNGFKKFEVRKDDRSFKVGDILHLKEISSTPTTGPMGGLYTGQSVKALVLYKLSDEMDGVAEDYCVLSLGPLFDVELLGAE